MTHFKTPAAVLHHLKCRADSANAGLEASKADVADAGCTAVVLLDHTEKALR